jgi:glyoxylase-like metal-dependent hydrolase (beta-lactamase superfamily II)/ferredoxin
MADSKKAVPENVNGDFFVDITCINCDACRQLAPESFSDAGATSCVSIQPTNAEDERKALRALICCPTASIGTRSKRKVEGAIADFPIKIEADVFYSGFNSAKSYGANSFFIQHKDGNWLIDSPRFVKDLAYRFRQMGGVKYIFLTHQDDIADAHKYALEFGASRIIHEGDLKAEPDSEIVVKGEDAKPFAVDFQIIPVPGHTKGHMVLLYKGRYLFTGDHLFFDQASQRLSATKQYCWYSWQRQIESMTLLKDFDFEWVLPGHGRRVNLEKREMQNQLNDLVERMSSSAERWRED